MDAITNNVNHSFNQSIQSAPVVNVEQKSQNISSVGVNNTREQSNDHTPQTKEEMKALVTKLNNDLEPLNTGLSFGYSDEIEQMVITVQDKNTGRTIRKFPTEEALKIAAKMKDIVGMIFDEKV